MGSCGGHGPGPAEAIGAVLRGGNEWGPAGVSAGRDTALSGDQRDPGSWGVGTRGSGDTPASPRPRAPGSAAPPGPLFT